MDSEHLSLEAWHSLPWLITRAVVMQWTGLSKRDLDEEVRQGRIRVYRGRRKRKFYKADIALIAGIPCGEMGRNGGQSGAIGTHGLDTAHASCLARMR